MVVVLLVGVAIVMAVVMLVLIERERAPGAGAEERAVLRRVADDVGRAFATDMVVEADHPIRGRHDHMEVMRHHEDGAAAGIADALQKLVERRLAGLVEALRRLVEDQEFRPPESAESCFCSSPCDPVSASACAICGLG